MAMKRFNLLKDNTRIEKRELYSKLQTILSKYFFEPNNYFIVQSVETEIQKTLNDNGYSDLQFQVTYKNNEININFDDE
jgi:uncharacterized Ntn-hydrolase superfamily protein